MRRPEPPERRALPRRWCYLAASWQDEPHPAEEVAVTDLTADGLCVALLRPAPLGAVLRLTPRPPGAGPELSARVVWVVAEGRYHWAGCTLERPLSPDQLERLLAAPLVREPPEGPPPQPHPTARFGD